METREQHHHVTIFYTLFFLQLLSNTSYSGSLDTITPTQSVSDGQTLVSSGQSFELGFFSPGSSNNRRYLGIWYKTTPDAIVWVANRNNPLNDSHGALVIHNKGHLALLNRTGSIIWSSSVSTSSDTNNINSPVAKLLESGNLVLGDKDGVSSEVYAWQSFDHPSDTFLAGMKIGQNFKTGLETHLTSWKSEDDPSTGEYISRIVVKGLPQFFITNKVTAKIKFRSGPWNGIQFSGSSINPLAFPAVFTSFLVSNEDEVYHTFRSNENFVVTRAVLNPSGLSDRLILYNKSTTWSTMYTVPYEACDEYGYCGANGFCRINTETVCECLQGFNPWSKEEWQVLNYSSGCVRRTPLDCSGGSDGFVKLEGVKVPDFLEFWSNSSMSLEECEKMCLRNCSCTAYANSDIGKGNGCMIWFGDLIDMREMRVKVDEDVVYLRLPAFEIKSIRTVKRKRRLRIILTVSILTSSICILILVILWRVLRKRSKMVKVGQQCDKVDVELPLFDLATITSATNNFSLECKIGAGGFGSVYKGTLITGQKVAIKRLSKNSRQGVKEFKNEMELIAKLQHRNLVSLLGYCIEAQERMLIYEYMPNRSLDHFIFDNNRSIIMGWQKKFDIIMGIARGLLYLHRDSKLQIIHRDLKAGNILLDDNFNPKISDFGLARIFANNEIEARTRRIVGTYGYMSPEYAIDGKFSVKSDVFSFGVLLLEIVSGKRNRRFHHPDHHHNLLGHAWLLWNEGRAMDLMNQRLEDSSMDAQVVRCIQVGLLCVQKFPRDRPTMSSIIFMLENEGAALPRPKQPGFFIERSSNDDDLKPRTESSGLPSTVTITMPR